MGKGGEYLDFNALIAPPGDIAKLLEEYVKKGASPSYFEEFAKKLFSTGVVVVLPTYPFDIDKIYAYDPESNSFIDFDNEVAIKKLSNGDVVLLVSEYKFGGYSAVAIVKRMVGFSQKTALPHFVVVPMPILCRRD